MNRVKFLVLVACMLLWAFSPLALLNFDKPNPIDPFLGGVFPTLDPNGLGRYQMKVAYTNLTFNDASVIVSAPDNNPNHPTHNMMFVGTVDGEVFAFENREDILDTEVITVMNNRANVYSRDETIIPTHPRDTWDQYLDGGFINMVFHPEFGQEASSNADYVYMLYTGIKNGFNVVIASRFTMQYDPLRIDLSSEQEMILIPKRGPAHYGGGMCFDNDGFLYIAYGDGMDPPLATQADRDYYFNSIHDLNSLYAKVIKIDVDKDPSRSHAPNNFFSIEYGGLSGGGYWIPNDNPYNGIEGALEEIYSIGIRAPHRMTYDPAEDQIWEGDVGWNLREEINIIEPNNNYQWPSFEGNFDHQHNFTNYQNNSFPYGNSSPPTWDFERGPGRFALIGGYVYRGNDLNPLNGKYLCGLFGSGQVYALTLDDETGLSTAEIIATKPGDKEIHTFGMDQQGEIYLGGNGEDQIYKLVDDSPPKIDVPATLSATGVFDDLEILTPASGLLPYEPKNPFWSDGAIKSRWIALPNDGIHDAVEEEIFFSDTESWIYPKGTVFIKHFDLETSPGITKKLETRFLIKDMQDNYYGLSYRWREDQSEADLVSIEGETRQISSVLGDHIWTYPSTSNCLNCHNNSRGFVLGFNDYQLNHDLAYNDPNNISNQLAKINDLGMFQKVLTQSDLDEAPQVAYQFDENDLLEDRARAYLDANCAYCHNPDAGTRANFDARYLTPLRFTGLVYGETADDLGLINPFLIKPGDNENSVIRKRIEEVATDKAMPPLAKDRIDQKGLKLISDWIASLDENEELYNPCSGPLLNLDIRTATSTVRDPEIPDISAQPVGNPNFITNMDFEAIAFDGINDNLEISGVPTRYISNVLTISAWVNVNDFDDWDGVVALGENNSPFAMQLWGDGSLRFTANWGNPGGSIGGGSWNSNTKLIQGKWHHVAITYDGETIKFYIDGNLDDNKPLVNLTFGQSTEPLYIGADFPGGDEYFDGLISDVRIYCSALEIEEIKTLFELHSKVLGLSEGITKLSVYPVPFTDQLTIYSGEKVNKELKYLVINNMGHKVYEGIKRTGNFSETINTSDWEPGIYFVIPGDKNTKNTIKVIKRN